MSNGEFFEKNKTILDVVEYYQKSGLDENTSQILAVKKIIETRNPETQMHYLGEDTFLDAKIYQDKFYNESRKYLKYFDEVFYDRSVPLSKEEFLEHLPKGSKLIQRFIAARIKDENFGFPPPKKVKHKKMYKYNCFEEVVENRKAEFKEGLSDKQLIYYSVDFVLNSNDEEFKQKILGVNPYLDYLLFKDKFNPENLDFFYDVFDQALPHYHHLDKKEKKSGLLKILESKKIDTLMNKFISAKLANEHFGEEYMEDLEYYRKYNKSQQEYEDD